MSFFWPEDGNEIECVVGLSEPRSGRPKSGRVSNPICNLHVGDTWVLLMAADAEGVFEWIVCLFLRRRVLR